MTEYKVAGEYPDLDSFHRAGHRTTADLVEEIRAEQRRDAELEHERKLAEIRKGTVKPSRRRHQSKPLSLLFPRSEFRQAIARGLINKPEAEASNRELLAQIDEDAVVPLPELWKKNRNDRSFEDAYMNHDGDRRRKIQVEISKVKGILRDNGLL